MYHLARRRAILALLSSVGAALSITTGCSTQAETSAPPGNAQGAPPTVAVTHVGHDRFSRSIKLTGEFRPYQAIELHARVTGYLKHIGVDVGDRVRDGQLLAELEIPELTEDLARAAAESKRADADLLRAKGELARAEANRALVDVSYERLFSVMKSEPGLVAQQELDEALARKRATDAQVDGAKAALAAAEQQIQAAKAMQARTQAMVDYCRITAPFAGMITKRYADTGAMVQSTPVVRLAQIDRLRLVIPVPESLVSKVRVGTAVMVNVGSLNRQLTARVARYSGDVQMATRTMDVEVDVPNPGDLVPGMYADAVVTVDPREDSVAIPVQALILREGKRFVMVVNASEEIEERALETGAETGSMIEALSGVTAGERVVVGNKAQLRPGTKVNARVHEDS